MKKKRILLLTSVLCASLMFACGPKEPEISVQPEPEVIDSSDLGFDEPEVEEEVVVEEEPVEEVEVLPEGYVRSAVTNELITEELANQRPIAVMIPMDQVAQPDFNNSKAGVIYEFPVEGSITRTMNIIEDWQDLEKIGNIRSTRDYFIWMSWEWDPILLHDGGPAIYITDYLKQDIVNNISGRGFRDSSRSAPHNEYYSAKIINQWCESLGYQTTHRDQYWNETSKNHFKFAKFGGETDLTQDYSDALEVYTVDMKECYPVTKSKFEYNAEDGLYYRYIYGSPHMDNADPENPVQLSFKNLIIMRCEGKSRDAKDYRFFNIMQSPNKEGYFLTNGHAIHIHWDKAAANETPTKFYDDNGNEITLSTGKTMICVVQDGGSASMDFIFQDSNGNTVDAAFK